MTNRLKARLDFIKKVDAAFGPEELEEDKVASGPVRLTEKTGEPSRWTGRPGELETVPHEHEGVG